jgi:hypothetical protein
MKIENQELFHIHSPDSGVAELEVGKEYEAGKVSNRFWRFYEQQEMRCGIPPYQGNFGAMALNRHASSVMIENHALNKAMLMYSASVLKECGMFIRELAFEEIRAREFADAPSRRTSLYVTEESGLRFWNEWLSGSPLPKFVYRIVCSGIVHKGSQQFLDSDISSFSWYENQARNYWSCVGTTGQINTEILFAGKFKVIEMLS